MSIKLFVTDLDGTLLNSDRMISQRNLDALAKAKAKGVHVTVATGRMYVSGAHFARQFFADAPVIACNGGIALALDSNTPVLMETFPEDLMQDFLRYAYARNWYIQWYIGTQIYAKEYRDHFFRAYKTTPDFHLNEVGDDYMPHTKGVIQCVVRDLDGGIPNIIEEIRGIYGDRIKPQQLTGYTIDLTPPQVSKAVACAVLADYYGITPDEIMACGDRDNDIEMLKYAGTAVVPENGSEEAKAAATYIAPSNDEDGIAKAIEDLILYA
ncbi:Cof-type HAD-IIB family hydrolase [Selenomonas sp. TAMA-11512]|uniref:Cof-type HAD-IIB family hydrolase n=1 Tax=Selenomonas sp. TAMA-11512 TaxID=3095337 RepID=UPI00308507C6|nr:Cof-type HAD-IIB family hydrolase [Selenomonas sp. TAMA-11512]